MSSPYHPHYNGRTLRRLAFLALPLVVLGCSSGGGFSKRTQTDQKGVFTYALEAAPTTFDPAMVQDIETTDVLQNIFEGLVGYDTENRIVGLLAEKWDLSPDGKTYTFHLAPAKFQNGREVTADDVVWTFKRNLSPAFNSPTSINYLSDIVGASAYHDGKAATISGISAPDPKTVKIEIDQPRPYFLGKLTYACAYVLNKDTAGNQPISDPMKANGTGPFKLTKFAPDQQVTLEAFADYRGGKPTLERIERPIILDPATRLNKYRSGDLDLLNLRKQEIAAAQADANLKTQLVFQPKPAVFYIGLSALSYPPFKDARVRRALALSIDRRHIVNDLLAGMPEARGLIPYHVIGYRENFKGLEYNPTEAKRLLAEAGFPEGKGLPPLRLTYKAQTPESQAIAESVATTVRQMSGWVVRPVATEWSALLSARNNRKLDAYVLSWYGDYLDPQNFLSFLFQSTSPQNRDGYRNAEFDRLTGQADVELNEAKRIELYQHAEDIAINDAARIPIYFVRDAILVNPRIRGIRTNLFGNLPHTTVEAN